MNVKSIEREGNKTRIVVEIDKELMEQGVNKAYLKARKDIQLPGFRRGKAPRKLIESIYGAHVFYEDGLEEIFPQVYETAIVEQKIKAVGRPSLSDMDIADDGSVTLTLETEVYPEVTLGQYQGLEVEKAAPVPATDEEVEAELNRMAKNVAGKETVDRPAENGDTANIDFLGRKDGVPFEGGEGKDYDLVLGSGSFIPGFEEQVVGMSAGEEKDIDVTFPENYHAKELAGCPVTFHVKVNRVTVELIPAKDDEFAKDVSEFDTLEQLKESIRANILTEREKAAQTTFENTAVDMAASNATVEIPEAMIQEELDRQMQNFGYQLQNSGMSLEQYAKMMGGDLDTMRRAFRPGAEKQVRVNVVLAQIMEEEKLEVSAEEIEAEYQQLADTYKMELEKVKTFVGEEELKDELLARKAARLITDSAIAVAPKAEEKAGTEEKTEA